MNVSGLQSVFAQLPAGGTPLVGCLRHIFHEKAQVPKNQVLLVVITDGEPTDGSRDDLFNVLKNKPKKFHVSFAECTDQAEDMEYLDLWDGLIPNFDNTEDYREELNRVKTVQGPQFKFDYIDYVVKILMATFVRWYFNLDQVKVFDFRKQPSNPYNNNIPISNPAIQAANSYSNPSTAYYSNNTAAYTQPVATQQQYYNTQPYRAAQTSDIDNFCCVIL
jgi:hypothetical protein